MRETEKLHTGREFLLLWGHSKDGSLKLQPRGAGQLKNSSEWGRQVGHTPNVIRGFPLLMPKGNERSKNTKIFRRFKIFKILKISKRSFGSA